MQTITAKLHYLKIAPRKARLVANLIKKMPVQEAEAQLSLLPKRSSYHILKLLRTGIADAKQNFNIQESKLFIKEIQVDQGPMLKRFMPRAQGRATPIQKKMSHITLILGEDEKLIKQRFVFPREKPKNKEKKEERDQKLQKETEEKKATISKKEKRLAATESQPKSGIIKKMFRRKSI